MKKNLIRLAAGLLLLAGLVACNKLGDLTPENFTVNPNPLEVKAGKVEGTITANFPEKAFPKKAVVEVTPVLKYEGGEATSAPATFQGEKVQGNATVIAYKTGGSVSMDFSFDFVPGMEKSTLVLRFKATNKNKEFEIPEIEVATGCVATANLVNAYDVAPALAKDSFQRVTQEVTEADIMFQIQRSNVKGNDEVKALNAAVAATKTDSTRTVASLELVSTASPDGGVKLNETLAAAREKNTKTYLKRQKNQAAIDAQYIAQDWEGFQKLVQESSVQDKELILRVLGTYQDPEEREAEIKKLSAAYTELAEDILPKLRRSHLKLTIDVQGKTDEEIIALADSQPDSLTVDELMFATTIAATPEAAAKYTKSNAEINAADWRTQNNYGALLFATEDAEGAKAYMDKAAAAGGSDRAETNFNYGLLALQAKDVDLANQYFGKAAGIEQLAEAQGTMYIMKGDYAKAVSAFGNTTSNNAALAQLLSGQTDKAAGILANVADKDFDTYYLMAVCAARQGQDSAVYSNLKEAAKLCKEGVQKAMNDIEFGKYWTLDEFKAALQ